MYFVLALFRVECRDFLHEYNGTFVGTRIIGSCPLNTHDYPVRSYVSRRYVQMYSRHVQWQGWPGLCTAHHTVLWSNVLYLPVFSFWYTYQIIFVQEMESALFHLMFPKFQVRNTGKKKKEWTVALGEKGSLTSRQVWKGLMSFSPNEPRGSYIRCHTSIHIRCTGLHPRNYNLCQ